MQSGEIIRHHGELVQVEIALRHPDGSITARLHSAAPTKPRRRKWWQFFKR